MTAVLDEIRRLEAAEKRGDISTGEMRAAKARLMNAIEDANAPQPAEPPRSDTEQPPKPKSAIVLWHIIFFCFGLAGICTAIATLILGDLSLALTITVTLLAAFTIHAFRTLDD